MSKQNSSTKTKSSTSVKRKAPELFSIPENEAISFPPAAAAATKSHARGPSVKRVRNQEGEAVTSEVAVLQKTSSGKKLWIDATHEDRSLEQSSVPLQDKDDVQKWLSDNLLIHRRKSSEKSKGARWELRIFKDGLGVQPEDIHPLADRVGLPLRFSVNRPHQIFNKPKQWDNSFMAAGSAPSDAKVPPKKNDHLLKPYNVSLPMDFVSSTSEDHLQYEIHETLRSTIRDYLLALPLEEKLEIFGPYGEQITDAWFLPEMDYWKYPISNWGENKDRWDLRVKFDTNSFTKQPNYVIYDVSDKSRKQKQPPMIAPSIINDGAGLFGSYVVSGFYVMQDWRKPLGGEQEEYHGFYVGYTASWMMAFHLDADTMRARGFSRTVEGNDKIVTQFKQDSKLVQKVVSNAFKLLDSYTESNQAMESAIQEAESTGSMVLVKQNRTTKTKAPSKRAGKGKAKITEVYDDEELEDAPPSDDEQH